MQPYQKAGREIQRQADAPGKFAKTAALAAPALAGSGAALSRILPLLSEFVPVNLASKGLEKIDSRFGKFIHGAMGAGHTMDEVMGFIKEKVGGNDSKKAPDQRSIIEQYSPELNQFIQQQIQQGRTALEAGAMAQLDKKFQGAIKKMEVQTIRHHFLQYLKQHLAVLSNLSNHNKVNHKVNKGAIAMKR